MKIFAPLLHCDVLRTQQLKKLHSKLYTVISSAQLSWLKLSVNDDIARLNDSVLSSKDLAPFALDRAFGLYSPSTFIVDIDSNETVSFITEILGIIKYLTITTLGLNRFCSPVAMHYLRDKPWLGLNRNLEKLYIDVCYLSRRRKAQINRFLQSTPNINYLSVVANGPESSWTPEDLIQEFLPVETVHIRLAGKHEFQNNWDATSMSKCLHPNCLTCKNIEFYSVYYSAF